MCGSFFVRVHSTVCASCAEKWKALQGKVDEIKLTLAVIAAASCVQELQGKEQIETAVVLKDDDVDVSKKDVKLGVPHHTGVTSDPLNEDRRKDC